MRFLKSGGVPNTAGIVGYSAHIGTQAQQQRAGLALKAAKTEADLANRAKTEFLANMSHELRTPLNAIIGFAQILADPTLTNDDKDKQVEYAEYIGDSAQHLLAIINNILDISKVEHGKMDLNLELTDAEELIDACLILVRDRCHAGKIELDTDYRAGDLEIYADAVKFKQIIVNLLTNAVKFTPAGGKILVKTECTNEGSLKITVRDTGVGMTQDEMHQALEPFGQAQSGYSRNQEGTGLGLPLTKALAELHGAAFKLTSAKGIGTQVAVIFPVDDTLIDRDL